MKQRDLSGPRNPRFNGGLCFNRGRWLIVCRDGTTMQFARGVMAAHLGRLLRSDEIVHHINGDPTDDRVENLALTSRAAHMEAHRPEWEDRRRESSTAARRRRAVAA